LFTLAAQEKGEEGIKFMVNEPWERVLQQAREQGRLVFMDCYTEWCGPCKGLAQNIFPLKQVGDFFNANFVNAQYDMEKGDGKMLYEKYREHIIGFPTLLLIDAGGKVVHQMAGYQEAGPLIAGMKAGLEGNSLFATRERYESGARDLETVAAYVDALDGAYQREKIPGVVADFLATIPVERLLEPEVWRIAGKHVKDPYTEQYRFVLQNIGRGYQYRLKVDRYALESQLASGMSNAVTALVKTALATRDADTLKLLDERAGYLKELLAKYSIKEFPTFLAKLEITDLLLAGDPSESYRALSYARKIGVLPGENSFVEECYRCIIEQSRDKKLIRACLQELVERQERQQGRVEFRHNYHDTIALAHDKLKESAAASEARIEAGKLDEARKAYALKLFGGGEEKSEEKVTP
jgi:thiol-disulfide isomerase/thioredoxin